MKEVNTVALVADDIVRRFVLLDEIRQILFLKWLEEHCCRMMIITGQEQQVGKDVFLVWNGRMAERLTSGLKAWFGTLPMQVLFRESHLILHEIEWWRKLEEERLRCFMEEPSMGREISV